jgi:hypothetical protein
MSVDQRESMVDTEPGVEGSNSVRGELRAWVRDHDVKATIPDDIGEQGQDGS